MLHINITVRSLPQDLTLTNQSPHFLKDIAAGSLFLTSNQDFKQLYNSGDIKAEFQMTRAIKLPQILDDMNGFTQIDFNYTSMLDHTTKMNISYSVNAQQFLSDPDSNVKYNPTSNTLLFTFFTVEQILRAKGKTAISITLRDKHNATRRYDTSFTVVIPKRERKARPVVEDEEY